MSLERLIKDLTQELAALNGLLAGGALQTATRVSVDAGTPEPKDKGEAETQAPPAKGEAKEPVKQLKVEDVRAKMLSIRDIDTNNEFNPKSFLTSQFGVGKVTELDKEQLATCNAKINEVINLIKAGEFAGSKYA
nr:hypothetical protein 10 [bacterium]